jgi:hypothetical protein
MRAQGKSCIETSSDFYEILYNNVTFIYTYDVVFKILINDPLHSEEGNAGYNE